jgi:hypothetical protein
MIAMADVELHSIFRLRSGTVAGKTELTMGDMNKIVTEHVRAADLPAHLRGGLPEGTMVKVTVEPELETSTTTPRRVLASFVGSAPGRYPDADDIVKEISELRDEWHS